MTIAWVLGAGGLLGSALCRALRQDGTELFVPAERFFWDRGPELFAQFEAAAQAFAAKAAGADRWELYWAAGMGTMSCTEDVLAQETHALFLILGLLASDPLLARLPGRIAFASSAGAIYAASTDAIITESTPPSPTTAYAAEKLKQESLLHAFAAEHPNIRAVIARISTLYGCGQASAKKQGLLTHIARSMLRNQAIQIYVPYDTIRDYIAADDAAAEMVSVLRRATGEAQVITKIVASEHPTTIAEIISIFKRVARRPPRIVTSASRLSALYARRVQFRSMVAAGLTRYPRRSLLVGIAQLIAAERAAFVAKRNNTP